MRGKIPPKLSQLILLLPMLFPLTLPLSLGEREDILAVAMRFITIFPLRSLDSTALGFGH